MNPDLKIAFVQDALPYWGGAENVLEAALECFPQAQIYTLLYDRSAFHGTSIAKHPIHVSPLDRLPGARRFHHWMLPLMPLAIRQLNLAQYDLVIAFSYAVAHAAPTRPDQLHLSYIHTPMRYAWRSQALPQVIPGMNLLHRLTKPLLRIFRRWDTSHLDRTDHFITNSQWMAGHIRQVYRREAEVLYPPVNTETFRPLHPRRPYYLYLGRLAAHKRVDLVVQAFSRLGLPLLVAGRGTEENRLRRMAGPNVRFLGWQSQASLASLLGRARAFVHAGEEDFGISMAEAQAAGCPVIALKRGGAAEIVSDGETGQLFAEQSVDGVCEAVLRFEKEGVAYNAAAIRQEALRFDRACFKHRLGTLVGEKWAAFQNRGQSASHWKRPTRSNPEDGYGCQA